MPNLLLPQAVCKLAISSCVENAMWWSATGLHASLRPVSSMLHLRHSILYEWHVGNNLWFQQHRHVYTEAVAMQDSLLVMQCSTGCLYCVLLIYMCPTTCMSDHDASLVKIFLRHICILRCTLGFIPALRCNRNTCACTVALHNICDL